MSVLIDYASSKEKRKGARKSQKYKGKNAFPRNKQRNSLRDSCQESLTVKQEKRPY